MKQTKQQLQQRIQNEILQYSLLLYSYKDTCTRNTFHKKFPNISIRRINQILKKYNFSMLSEKEFKERKLQKNTQRDDLVSYSKKAEVVYEDYSNETGHYFSYSNYTSSHNMIDISCSCGEKFSKKAYVHLRGSGCPNKPKQDNKPENEIKKIIEDNLEDTNIVEMHNKSLLNGKEIDIYVPKYKFGIEYNGLLWHSIGSTNSEKTSRPDTTENRKQHLIKTEIAETKGIQLFHVFENEWLNPVKKDIWISMFKDKMHKNIKIGARKTEIRCVDSDEAKKFQEENHLQGAGLSKIRLGLYYNNELVSLMTFAKGRSTISGKFEYELIRFCNKKGYTIQGGASKLLKHFEREYRPKSLVSFANRRWSVGNLYKQLGFTLSHTSAPNYFYFKNKNILYSRNKFQKHKLKDVLLVFDLNKTEWQNMDLNGYRKIYDCGNYVFVKTYEYDNLEDLDEW